MLMENGLNNNMQPDFTKLKPVVSTEQPDFANLKPVVASEPVTETLTGTLLNPLKESVQGLKTLYGGGEQGIANKLVTDVKQGAADIQKGDVIKGVVKSGGRTAGDIAGTIYAPIGAAVGSTGIGKIFEDIQKNVESGKGAVGNLIDYVTNIPAVQEFALKHPNAGEDFGRVLNLLFSKAETGKIEPSTSIARTSEQISAIPRTINNLRPTAETIAQERQVKLNKGFDEQNTRLKSADKSFNKNTIIRNTDKIGSDGLPVQETITPIDTFSKYGVSPIIEKGSIQMGDYKTGVGELGKIKDNVQKLDAEIDTNLVNSGKRENLETLKQEAINRAKNDPDIKQAGNVGATVKKIEARFEDYKQSYGDDIDVAELNNIRKTANKDWNPETTDVSSIVGDVARDVIYNVTPDKAIRSLLRQQGELLAAKKYAESINGTKVTGGRLGTMALRTTGAIIGSTLPKLPIVGPIIGAIGGEFASRALQQSQFKSAWTELRSLIQRSNSSEQINNAKTTPNSESIGQNNVKASDSKANIDSTSNRIMGNNIPENKGIIKRAIDYYKSIPNKQGGFVKIGGKVFKEIPEATKKEMIEVIDYLNLKKPVSKSMESTIEKLLPKYNINQDWSNAKIADALEKLVENTKTK